MQLARITNARSLRTYTDSGRNVSLYAKYRVRSFVENVNNSSYSNEVIIGATRYDSYPPIAAGNVLHSAGGAMQNGVLTLTSGETVRLSVDNPRDYDDFYNAGVKVVPHRPQDRDNLFFDWRGSNFSGPHYNDSNGTVWTAPNVSTPQTFTLTVEINDTKKDSAGKVIGGRTASDPRNDNPINRSLTVKVVPKIYYLTASHNGSTTGGFETASKPEFVQFSITITATANFPNAPESIKLLFKRPKTGDTASLTATADPGKKGVYTAYWTVTRWQGKWNVTIDPAFGKSNTLPIRIDKRGQIARLANNWADIWPSLGYKPGEIAYPQFLPPYPKPTPKTLFGGCDSFTEYIYGYLGLAHSPGALSSGLPLDSGLGALRNFRGGNTPTNSTTFDHVGILVGDGQMVDVNNANNATGPQSKGVTWGTGTFGEYWGGSNPVNRAYPDPKGSGKSQLQILDLEN